MPRKRVRAPTGEDDTMKRADRRSCAAAAFGLAMLALPATALAQAGEFVDGVLQPLEDGFPNRAITLINPDEPGSRDGIYVRSILEAVRDISPVDVILSDEPAPSFATFYVLSELPDREGGNDGYYVVTVSVPGTTSDLTTEPITEETGLDVDDMHMVITTDLIPYVLMQRKDAPWGPTFAGMVEYAKAHPGEIRYISNQVGSGNDLAMEWIIGETGIEVTKIPAPSNDAAAATIGAGEGDFTLTQAGVALQHFQAGVVDVTLVTGDTVPAPWNEDTNVVSGSAAGLPPSPWGVIQGFAVPDEVPAEHVEWLFKLFAAAAATDTHMARETTVPGAHIRILGPAESNEIKNQVLAYADEVVRRLGLHIDQQ